MSHTNLHYESMSRQKTLLSLHAKKRAQQRGICESAIRIVMACGKPEYDGKGGKRYLMDGDAMDALVRDMGHTPQMERLRGVYVVVDAEEPSKVITTGHRYN